MKKIRSKKSHDTVPLTAGKVANTIAYLRTILKINKKLLEDLKLNLELFVLVEKMEFYLVTQSL
jgi:hypothetical protein